MCCFRYNENNAGMSKGTRHVFLVDSHSLILQIAMFHNGFPMSVLFFYTNSVSTWHRFIDLGCIK